MRPVLVFSALFVSSMFGVVAGYSDFPDVFSWQNWNQLMVALPMFRAATAFTATSLSSLLLAFWESRGDRDHYNNSLLGYGYLLPFVVALLVLPGAESKPAWASLNLFPMFTILCLAQIACTRALRDWFWLKGGRE